MKSGSKQWLSNIGRPIMALIIALLLGAIVIYVGGDNPWETYAYMLRGAIGSKQNLAETVLKTASLTFAGLSYAFAYRCGLLNIGIEGQLIIGAVSATALGVFITGLPAWLHLIICILGGVLSGAIVGGLVAVLKNKFGASEVITTVMFNYIILNFANYLAAGPLRESSAYAQSAQVQETARLPVIIPGTRVNLGLILAVLALVIYWFFWEKTKYGFEMKLVGRNQSVARSVGINVKKNAFLSMFVSGGLAGMVGVLEILGIQFRLFQDFSSGYGFDGIAVALLGSGNPIGIFLSAFLFGSLKSGSNAVQMYTNVPSAVVLILSGLMIVAMTVNFMEIRRGRKA